MDIERDTVLYLCNFDIPVLDAGHGIIKNLWSGDWTMHNNFLCKEFLASGLEVDSLKCIINGYREDTGVPKQILQMAINAFLSFCDINWNAHAKISEQYFKTDWPDDIDAAAKLQKDSEPLHVNILHPELLYFSSQIFSALYSVEENLIHLWWCLRCKLTHQRALEDTSATLFSELEFIIAKLSNMAQKINNTRLKVLLYAEIAQAFLVYARIQKVEDYLLKARDLAGLKLKLTGILGKRTKFQQNALPQLALTSELDSTVNRTSAGETHGSSQLPAEIELQDDVRLNKIQFEEQISQAELPSLEQTLCLLTVQYIQKSQPKDDLMTEEIQPYIEAVLSQGSGPWSTRVAALLIRCKLEANHKRTVERAMLQCETIVNDKTGVSPTNRLSYLWASGLAPAWTWRQQLADLYLSLGLVKAALEEYQTLQLWEDVIVCYTMLQLRHKAAEVIQQQIDIKPTIKLYCLLGDATDDVSCYEKAWQFSNCKSSRAQRHWGNFLFEHKKYEECIPHYEKSVEINSLQEAVWLRLGSGIFNNENALGFYIALLEDAIDQNITQVIHCDFDRYAALHAEQWEVSGRAYRRYTYLQPNTFEAWNNLAKVYVKQGDKNRAYRALCEALKFNYDNWKLWENFILVSMDTGHFEDVMRGCHRLLDIQRRFDDVELLRLLVRAILQDNKDADGNSAGRLRKRALELFGHITSVHQNNPDIWQLYSDLSPTYLLKAQRLQKAYKGFTQNGNWPNNPETCKKVMELAQLLLEYSLKAKKDAEDNERLQANQQLSSARLTGQAVIRAAEKQDWPETKQLLQDLKTLFSDVTEFMKSEL